MNEFWNSLSEVKKAVCGIIFINSLVMIAGFIPQLRNVMFNNFVMSTYSSNSLSEIFKLESNPRLRFLPRGALKIGNVMATFKGLSMT